MKYQVGDKVSWRSINRDFTGVVEGYRGPFAVVRIDGSGKYILLGNKPLNTKDDGDKR